MVLDFSSKNIPFLNRCGRFKEEIFAMISFRNRLHLLIKDGESSIGFIEYIRSDILNRRFRLDLVFYYEFIYPISHMFTYRTKKKMCS